MGDFIKLEHIKEGDAMKRSIAKKNNTFIVKIENCQNGTWQGQVVWADENRAEHFRSLLELIKLISAAMAQGVEVRFGKRDAV